MSKYYSKVLRKLEGNYYIFKNCSLDIKDRRFEEYPKWIQKYRKQNYSQIIIDSVLMLKIMKKASFNDFILKGIKFEEGHEEELETDYETLNDIILKIEQNIKFIFKLEEYLNKIVDKNSIFITKLIFNVEYDHEYFGIEIKDNGIIISDNEKLNSYFFNKILSPILEEKYNNV